MNKKTYLYTVLLISIVLMRSVSAAPPEKYTIEGIDFTQVQLATNKFISIHDKDTDSRAHLAFVECVNAVLAAYGDEYRLAQRIEDGGEVTVSTYLDDLAVNGIRLYRMRELKGKVLRAIISCDLPVLLLGEQVVPHRNVHFANTDVVYLYREPDFVQSSRKLDDDIVFRFKTGRGGQIDCKEFFEPSYTVNYNAQYNATNSLPAGVKWVSVESEYSGFDFYYILATEELTLKKIKKKINSVMNDIDFKYQLPEFKQLKPTSIDW